MKIKTTSVDISKEGSELIKYSVDSSKFFGSPVFPRKFMEKYIEEDDYFVAQISLSELTNKISPLPKNGILYFFLNVAEYPYKAKVVYTNDELYEVIEGFNDAFDFIKTDSVIYMDFTEDDGECEFIAKLCDNEISGYDTREYKILLKIDPMCEGFPNLGSYDGYCYFLIKPSDLENLDFSNVEYIAYES